MAERALQGAGDAMIGEWRERGRNGVVHIRRRLTDEERRYAGRQTYTAPLCVRDIRRSEEAARRRRALLADAPYLREWVDAMVAEEAA